MMSITDTTTHGLEETFVLLDNSAGGESASLLFSKPVEIVIARTPDEVGAAFDRLQAGLDRGLHAAGFFAYELGYVLEPKLAPLIPGDRTVPLIWLGLYETPREMSESEVDHWLATHTRSGSYQFHDVSHAWTEAEYQKRFDQVIENIRAGDIYQLNLTFKARFRLDGSPLTFYRDMRRRQRVAYAGIVDTGDATILSASPELFVEMDGQTVSTRPMKGTSPRAGTLEADAEAKRILATDAKQRAENLMIVDLMRNDLGRISEVGSVEVTDLFTVETFQTLHQMTSGVKAKLDKDLGFSELMRGIFSPGSVTGAPKIRAMELIREYETEARGVYCGAIGHLSPKGSVQLNVAIRTPVVFRGGAGEMGIGSGVVYDSVGSKEYAECLLKMKFLTDPPRELELIETLLYEPDDGFWLLERHLNRLQRSASYFDFPYDRNAVIEALQQQVEDKRHQRLRVRLLLNDRGRLTVTATAIDAAPDGHVIKYAVSSSRLNSADALLFHKTTRRELYDREWQHYHDSFGTDEVLYLNERGEVAEGARSNVFVSIDGQLFTPPLTAGLLPGVLREDLIEEGRARERVLTLQDLEKADAVYLGNSVRGLQKARLTEV
jgi:para-aminobenzoate synthetase / 4-amino-4-deoxychorismate lyase